MIRSVEIKGLRGIQEGKLEDFTPLVIFVGTNGSGKSTVLEAMLIGASQYPEKAIGYVANRRPGVKQGYEWLFRSEFASEVFESKEIYVHVATDANCERTIRLNPSNSNFTNERADYLGKLQEECEGVETANTNIGVTFRDSLQNQSGFWGRQLNGVENLRILESETGAGGKSLHTLYTQATKAGRREEVNALLRDIVPELSHIEILTEEDSPIIHLVYKNRSIPAAIAGSGIYTLLRLSLELAAYPDRVVLLEEPEVYKHPGAMRQSARAIWAAVRRGIQVIISTHSMDFIDALLVEFRDEEELDKMSVYRLLLVEGCLRSSRTAGSEITFARVEIGEDLR